MLGLFANFAVAFTYLSPMVGIYSLFVLGVGTGGPAYIWLTWLPVIGMLFVALVFGELASHYPVAGALFQYSKFSVGPRYGWFVGWFYGFALLITVAAVDTGVVSYVTALTHNWFGWNLNPADHGTILLITLILLAIQTTLNITGASVMGNVAKFGVYVEIVGTLGIAIILAIHGFHHGLGFLFTTQDVQHVAQQPARPELPRQLARARRSIAVLAPVYIFYGFESAGDISEETKDAGRQVPKAMRWALIWGGIASFILIGALLLAMPEHNPIAATIKGGGIPFILGELPSWLQDCLLLLIIFAFFSCGTSIQGAGSRLAFSYARDGALPGLELDRAREPAVQDAGERSARGRGRHRAVRAARLRQPGHNYHVWFVTYPANVNALVALVSFGVSGIYLAFFLTVIAAIVARARGWKPEGKFQLGHWGWPVCIIALVYLGAMLVNVVFPSGLASPRGYFNIDWITLVVIVVIAIVGALYLLIARPDRNVERHLKGAAEQPDAPPVTTA